MHKSATGLVALVTDFLDLSKLESGHVDLVRAATNVFELACTTVENYRPLAVEKNITVTCEGDRMMPAINADARRLDQVLTNLLTNALKFTPREAGSRSRRHAGTAVPVSIKDTGVAFPAPTFPICFKSTAKPAAPWRRSTRAPAWDC